MRIAMVFNELYAEWLLLKVIYKSFFNDRDGHNLRYAIDSNKLKNELGWEPSLQFEEGIEKTVRWYLEH